MMKKFTFLLLGLCFAAASVQAARIKDVAEVAGVRSNQLVGYGLVTGLPGTGEKTPFTEQSFRSMLEKFGIQMPIGLSLSSKTWQRLSLPQNYLRSQNLVSAWT